MNPVMRLMYYQAIVAVTFLSFDCSLQYVLTLRHSVHWSVENDGDGGDGDDDDDAEDVGVGVGDVDVLYQNALDVDACIHLMEKLRVVTD